MQPGLLFHRPTHEPNTQAAISSLLSSFSAALARFFPLAGRLRASPHDAASLCFSLACNDRGAEFVHATAPSVTVSDFLSPRLVPAVVHSFFPLNGLVNCDGLDQPLLAAQATELADGIFVAVSLNHSVADASTLWHFINTWSDICRSGAGTTSSDPPSFERWFPDSCPPPYPVPSRQVGLVGTAQPPPPPFRECFLHFSAESVAKLKSRANAETGGTDNEISSLQSLLAHVWRAATRARGLKPEEECTYGLIAGYRARLGLPRGYFGNSAQGVVARASAGEVAGGSLGRAAWLLHRAVASLANEAKVRESVDSWWRSFAIPRSVRLGPACLATGSSPRFDVYGNDFGWGRLVAVRNGRGLKADGIVTVYPGRESGSMELEVCLSPDAMTALLEDEEFMEAVVHA